MTNIIGKAKVLICDDNESNFNKLRSYLENNGFQCVERVETEAEVRLALSAAEDAREWFQFVMLDMDLSMGAEPKASGLTVYHSILPEFPNEAYIIYSSHDADQYRDEINRLMYRDVKFVLLDSLLKEKNIRLHLSGILSSSDPRRVFLVHGRNYQRKSAIHRLLTRGFGLEVVGWEDARDRVKNPRPYIYEIVMQGIEMSHLTLVLFSDDETVDLREKFKDKTERVRTTERRQSRANVFIEAGYAMGVRPRRTVFLEWPDKGSFSFESPSDFSGLHAIRFDGREKSREVLKRRLESARCALNLSLDWKTV